MPLRALSRIHARLSAYFYPYGKACTYRAVPLLLLSLASVCLLSYPIILDLLRPHPPFTNQLDAQFWQFSPHLQISNLTSSEIIVQQIRLANYDGRIDADLFNKADVLQKALMTTFVQVNGKTASLASICLLREGECALQSPVSHYHAEQDGGIVATGTNPVHPYSVFGNVTFENDGKDWTADSLILTLVFKRSCSTLDTERVWDTLWDNVMDHVQLAESNHHNDDDSHGINAAWQRRINVQTQNIQYKYKHFVYQLSWQTYLCVFTVLGMCYLMSQILGNAHLVKSQLALGTAAVMMPAACLITTMGICRLFNIESDLVPWYLKIVVPVVGCIENVFVLTNAVLSAGCDMQIKEKIGRALESLGVPMTVVLCLELTITALGAAMGVPKIKQFCVFAAVALVVDYILDMTFYLAVLSLDVKRVELTDLDDREMSKRLRELAKCDIDADPTAEDYCPVQEPPIEEIEPKTCAECKHFKTYRTLTSLLLCLIILTQFSLRHLYNELETSLYTPRSNEDLYSLSSEFWGTVNPFSEPLSLQINPPYVILFAPNAEVARLRIHEYETYYVSTIRAMQTALKMASKHVRERTTFERIFVEYMRLLVTVLLKVNIPSLLLCIVLVCLIVWITPPWREQWLLPLLKAAFVKSVNHITYCVCRFMQYSPKILRKMMLMRDADGYDKDGVHRGAISVQSQFNESQNRKKIQVKTLSGKHIADIRRITVNAKHGTAVSCGQDGRIVLWNTDNAEWMARLDRAGQSSSGLAAEDLNPSYWTAGSRPMRRQYSGRGHSKRMPSARFVKIDQGNRWIASGFDDGVIRVWNMSSGSLVRELHVETEMPVTLEDEERDMGLTELRRRRQSSKAYEEYDSRRQRIVDRVVALQFIGNVAEYCHPLVAEAAARRNTSGPSFDDSSSQNYLVSAHKSGTIREWDILSGECINSISSGHTKDITALHVVECKAPHRKLGVTWIFTASKDGTVKSWERRLQKSEGSVTGSVWSCMYSLNGHNAYAITSLATESPVGGMGALVTGSSDGAVKVWNFETGEAVCTLSIGGLRRSKEPDVHVGGPLLKIKKLELTSDVDVEKEESDTSSTTTTTVTPDHAGSINQVVITRYCEVESGPGFCRGCDTCFGDGFLVASCATDEKVHVWRLERADGGHEHNCTLCSQDYHRKKYTRHRKSSKVSSTDLQDAKIKSPKLDTKLAATTSHRKRIKPALTNNHPLDNGVTGDMFQLEPTLAEDQLLDIEQLGGERDITLAPSFLGEINQLAGRGLVFCDNNVLAGVRKKAHSNEWEAWFAALQYYEPSASEQETIPVQAIDLEQPTAAYADSTKQQQNSKDNYIKDQIFKLLGLQSKPKKQPQHFNNKKLDDLPHRVGSEDDEEEEEANEILPFSVIRHVVPLDGSGLGCDYGNFIKLVYLDDACRAKQRNFLSSYQRGVAAPEPIKEPACDCGSECCGGTKSDCSHSSRKSRKNNFDKKATVSLRPVTCNMTDCVITNCPRASECVVITGRNRT